MNKRKFSIRINIEWVAPWFHSGPWHIYAFHWIRSEKCPGVRILGFCIVVALDAQTHGFHIGVML